MRFSCDNCQSRYTIADEKVRGRVLRVRCKRCGNAIVLKPVGAEAQAEEFLDTGDDDVTRVVRQEDVRRDIEAKARAAPLRVKPSAPDKKEWFLIAGGAEQGPLSRPELREAVGDARLTPRTYIWREGMDDWLRLKDVAELSDLCTLAESLSVGASSEAAERGKEAEEEFASDSFHELTPSPAAAPISELISESFEEELSSSSGGDLSSLMEPKAESGDAVAEEKVDPFALVPDAAGFEAPEPGETTNAIIKASGAKEKRWGRVALTLVAGAVVLGLAGFLGLKNSRTIEIPEPAPKQEAAPSIDWSKVEALDKSQLDALSGESQKKEEPKKGPSRRRETNELSGLIPMDDGMGRRDDGPGTALSPDQIAQLERLKAERAGRGGPGTAGPRAFVEDSTFDVRKAGSSGPDPQLVVKKISEAQPAIGLCVGASLRRNPNQKLGKVVVLASVGASGVVTRTSFAQDRYGIGPTELGQCVSRVVKGIVFPSFDGDPVDLEIPLVLGAG